MMARGITRRLTHSGLIPLAALAVLALSACEAKAPAATTERPRTGGTASPAAPSRPVTGTGSGTTSSGAGAGSALTDGHHDGYLTAVDLAKRTVTFDKVELLSGEAARKAYQKKNPGASDGPDNDYFLVNDNKKLRTLPVADGATVAVVDLAKGGGATPVPSSFAKLPAFLAVKDNSTLFKLTVKGGKVTAMESIYLP